MVGKHIHFEEEESALEEKAYVSATVVARFYQVVIKLHILHAITVQSLVRPVYKRQL